MKNPTFKDIEWLAKKLRSKTGCPWDRKQTISSMMENLSEEAEEVTQAIKNKDHINLKEELGDLLFQIVMIAQIAKENRQFDIKGVLKGIDKKIRSRHTWVFGKEKAKTAEEAISMWLKNKEKEKQKKAKRKPVKKVKK